MPIDTRHPSYIDSFDNWRKCRDCCEGEDAVKGAGVRYLRRIDPTQSSADYEAYCNRATFREAFGRTVAGCVGAIARREHTLDFPDAMQGFIADATCDGVSLAEFVKLAASETLTTGRGGVLVDYDEGLGRAFLALYQAEAITNWGAFGIVLHETVFLPDPVDEMKEIPTSQFRQLHLIDGAYTVSIWRKRSGATDADGWVIEEQITPMRRGQPLTEIPFMWLSFLGRTNKIVKPPLLGLANASLNYWRMSADLQHGRHFTGLPTLVVTGASDDKPLTVGGSAAIILTNENAKVYYAEFQGQGLGSLERGLGEVVEQMATLGAAAFGRMNAAETAEAARIRAAGESSILMGVVDAVESTMRAALAFAAEWMGAGSDPVVVLNREFFSVHLDPQILSGMVAALQAGAITPAVFNLMLDQAQMLPAEAAA